MRLWHVCKQSMSSAYVLSRFTGHHASGILKPFVNYLPEYFRDFNAFAKRLHSVFSDMQGLIPKKYRRYHTQAGNFNLAYCSRALESSDWFPWVTHISSHQSGSTLSLMVYVKSSIILWACRRFWESSKRFNEINSTLPLTERILVMFVHSPWSSGNNVDVFLHNGLDATHYRIGGGQELKTKKIETICWHKAEGRVSRFGACL